jgi:hypothetical protein
MAMLVITRGYIPKIPKKVLWAHPIPMGSQPPPWRSKTQRALCEKRPWNEGGKGAWSSSGKHTANDVGIGWKKYKLQSIGRIISLSFIYNYIIYIYYMLICLSIYLYSFSLFSYVWCGRYNDHGSNYYAANYWISTVLLTLYSPLSFTCGEVGRRWA